MKRPRFFPVLPAVLLSALSLVGLSISFPSAATSEVSLLPFTAVWAVALMGLLGIYHLLFKLEKPFSRISLWIVSSVLAGIATLAPSFSAVGTAELISGHKLLALLYFVGRVPLLYAALRLLQHALTARPIRSSLAWPTWAGAAALLLCWSPYLLFLFPGTVSNDSITQLAQLVGVEPFSNGNPVFQTGLIEIFRLLGLLFHGGVATVASGDTAVALYCLVQAVLMAWLLAAVLKALHRAGTPQWLLLLGFFFYAFCPIFPIYAFCVGKDTNFAMAVLWLSVLVWQQLRASATSTPWQTVWLCLAAALCALLRNAGIALAGVTMAVFLCKHLLPRTRKARPKSWVAPLAALATLLCVYGAVHVLALPRLQALPTPETENYSLPLQQVARVVASEPDSLSPEQRTAIEGVLPVDQLKSAYIGELSDPVKDLWKADASPAQKRAFFAAWVQLGLSHPSTYFSATFHNTYGYVTPGYLSPLKPTLLIGKQKRTDAVDGKFDFTVNPRSATLKSAMDSLNPSPLWRAWIAPGLYGWILLFSLATLLCSRRKRLLIALLPALFTLAGCLFSAVNGYFRYAMPLYLCAPLLLGLCAHALAPQTNEGDKCL